MAKKKTYYQILGVAATATLDEIRSAYRKLGLKYHPDRHKQKAKKKKAEEKFKTISQAYDILHDPGRRRQYDLSLRNPEIPRPSAKAKQPKKSSPRPQREQRQHQEQQDASGYNTGSVRFTFVFGAGTFGGAYSKTAAPDPNMAQGETYSKTSKGPCLCDQCMARRRDASRRR